MSFLFYNDLKHLFCLITLQLILWEEEHTYSVFSLLTNRKAEGICDL